MDIKIIDGSGEEIKQEPQEFKSEQLDGNEEFNIKAVGQVMGLEEKELAKYDDKLHTLLEYAKMKTDDHSREGLKWAIRSLELKLNTPAIGEKMIDYVSRYAYLELEGMRIDKEKEKYSGNL